VRTCLVEGIVGLRRVRLKLTPGRMPDGGGALEIEAELPREFEGAALLASSGLPRRVQIKAAKDALKLSTAYRADRLVGDIVRTTLRGSSATCCACKTR